MVDAQQLVYCTCMLNQQGAADKKSYDGITSVIMATFKPFFYLNLFTLSFSPPPTQPEAIKDRSRQNAKKAKRFRETIDTKEKKKSKRQSQTTNNKKMQKMLVLKKKKKMLYGARDKMRINVREKTGDGSHGLSLLLSTSLGSRGHHVEGFIHLSVF